MRTHRSVGARFARAAEASRGQRRTQRNLCRRPAANRKLYSDNPLGTPAFDAKVKLLESIDTYARGRTRACRLDRKRRRDMAGGGNPSR